MSSLTFKRLVIFSPIEELAKVVELNPGLNVITSIRKDGNDLGKSIIAKSFYHCLGADCYFDTKFDGEKKIFAVTLEHDGEEYIVYRNGSFFKLFDSELHLLWSTSHRHELGEYLYEQFGFAIWLPARKTNEIEITPPAYSFAPYFIDQNQYNGSSFNSFENLGQYKGYKESLIYTFAGVYDEEYFRIQAEKEPLESRQKEVNASIEVNSAMSERITDELSGLGYSADMETLDKDCSQHELDYTRISEKLGKAREQLYSLREARSQIKMALEGANALGQHLNKRIGKFNGEKCPICNNDIEDQISIRVAACVTHADVLLLGEEFQKELNEIERSISSKERVYSRLLDELEALKKTISALRQENMTAVQIEGLTKLSKNLTNERGRLEIEREQISARLKKIGKKLRNYSDLKADVNARYIQILASYVGELNLQSVDIGKIKNVTNRFEAAGSNAPLATVAWYFALLNLKDEFNPSRPDLPLILDSPMNVEADDEKYEKQYGLIFDTFKYENQMLVTGLGLAASSVVPKGANIIVLDNEKYQLLSNEDYESVKDIMFSFMEQQ